MAKYPYILQTSVSGEVAEFIDRVAQTESLSVASVVRMLITRGAATLLPPQPQPHVNGHAHRAEAANGRV